MELSFLIQLPLLFFSIIVHEYSHGAVADYFGDDTARVLGRLTLNPIPHIDPVGSILLPIFCLLAPAPVFGWAKPVPVNHRRLRNPNVSLVLVSGVGPAMNLALAVFFAIGLRVGHWVARDASFYHLMMDVLNHGILINLYLCVFNLLPIHPLDGSRVVSSLLPGRWAWHFDRLAPHGFILIVLLVFTGLFGKIVTPVVYLLYKLLAAGVF